MLYCARVELLEENAVVPACFDRRNFIRSLFAYTLRVDSIRYFHSLEWVRLKEKSESVPSDFFSCQLFASHHTVRSCLQEASRVDLSRLSELEGEHVCGNRDSSHISKSILRVKPAGFDWKLYLISALIGIKRRCEGSQRSMIVVPTTPVVFSLTFAFEREIMEHSSSVALAFFDNAMKSLVRVCADLRLGVSIDLQC